MDSLNKAIETCDNKIEIIRERSKLIFIISFTFFLISVVAIFMFISYFIEDDIAKKVSPNSLYILYFLVFIFTMIFGVLMSVYRYHLKETSKYEYYKIGFLRVNIAMEHIKESGHSEIITSLTKDAFQYETLSNFLGKKKINSPIEGHPASDISTALLNKIIDSVEINKKGK